MLNILEIGESCCPFARAACALSLLMRSCVTRERKASSVCSALLHISRTRPRTHFSFAQKPDREGGKGPLNKKCAKNRCVSVCDFPDIPPFFLGKKEGNECVVYSVEQKKEMPQVSFEKRLKSRSSCCGGKNPSSSSFNRISKTAFFYIRDTCFPFFAGETVASAEE